MLSFLDVRPGTPPLRCAALLTVLLGSCPAAAELQAGFTATHQAARGVSPETLASGDFILLRRLGSGSLLLYVEGATTPERRGVSARHPLANGDAGSALDGGGSGRVQISELFYEVSLAGGTVAAGLIDATRFIDGTGGEAPHLPVPGFADDETASFLNAAFVDNPAIAFPDYAPGVTWSKEGLRLLVSGGTGLGDTPNARYGEAVDLGVGGRGVFLATEAYRPLTGRRTLRLGLWHNSRDPRSDRGAYVVTDGRTGDYRWNLRAGMAQGHLATAERFVGLGAGRPVPGGELGAGAAWLDVRNGGSAWQTELYWRLPIGEHWRLTPDLQWLREPDGRTAVVAGLRITAAWTRP